MDRKLIKNYYSMLTKTVCLHNIAFNTQTLIETGVLKDLKLRCRCSKWIVDDLDFECRP